VCEIDLDKYIAISVVVFLFRFVLRIQFFCKENFEKMYQEIFFSNKFLSVSNLSVADYCDGFVSFHL
jgi:hypothetical protein